MTQEEVLKTIIKDNCDTEFGREHHFSEINSWEDYKKYVPALKYRDYEEMTERMMQGETNVLTAYPLACFLMTSGSSGKPKNIPLTTKALDQYSSLIFDNLVRKVPDGMLLHTSVFRYPLGSNCLYDDHSKKNSLLLSAAYFGYLAESGAMDLNRFSGGKFLNFSYDIQDVMFVKSWCALYEEKLVGIQSIFLYDALMLLVYIEKNWKDILRYMQEGHIPEDIRISDKIREYLIRNMTPGKERMDRIEHVLQSSPDDFAEKLWPDLKLVSGIGGQFFESKENILRHFIGNIPVNYFALVSSECMAGIAVDAADAEYQLISDNGYYEFEDTETGEIYNCSNLPYGRKSELILTNWSGLYRYRSKDLVIAAGRQNGMPVIRYLNRIKMAINIAGEKTLERMLDDALVQLKKSLDIEIFECSIWADADVLPGRYLVLLELEKGSCSGEVLCREFDDIMRQVSPDYDDLRNLSAIGFPKVVLLKKGTHAGKRRQSSQLKPELIGHSGKVFDFSADVI